MATKATKAFLNLSSVVYDAREHGIACQLREQLTALGATRSSFQIVAPRLAYRTLMGRDSTANVLSKKSSSRRIDRRTYTYGYDDCVHNRETNKTDCFRFLITHRTGALAPATGNSQKPLPQSDFHVPRSWKNDCQVWHPPTFGASAIRPSASDIASENTKARHLLIPIFVVLSITSYRSGK